MFIEILLFVTKTEIIANTFLITHLIATPTTTPITTPTTTTTSSQPESGKDKDHS